MTREAMLQGGHVEVWENVPAQGGGGINGTLQGVC